ncbi:MAG: WYL domain-containing protein, partial [Desulfuromonadales bacterium]|nr:WYL domain-containing protein [Desulfuromonadales bacterium]
METIVRHWHILRLIPRYPRKVTAGKIYQSLQESEAVTTLTKRTVERDLHFLSGLFPLQFDGCKPQGW